MCLRLLLVITMVLPGIALRSQDSPGPVIQAGVRQKPNLTLAWGDRFIPLTLWATPYYFKAEVVLKQEEILELRGMPLRFYQNDRVFPIPGLQLNGIFKGKDWPLTLEDTTGSFPVFSPAPDSGWAGSYRGPAGSDSVAGPAGQRGYRLAESSQQALVDHLMPGEQLVFATPPGKSTGIVITGLVIKAYNPWETFTPRFYLPPVYGYQDDVSTWQLVKLTRHPRMLIRYHAKDSVALKVRDMYAGNPKYQLVPIANFRTDTRYISDADYVVPFAEVERTDTLTTGPIFDPYTLQEYALAPHAGGALAWGKADIALSGSYLKQEEFLAGLDHPLRLVYSGQTLPILQALVTVAPPNGPVHQYLIDARKPESWKPFVRASNDNLSIYFEDIVLQEKDGMPRRLPQPFAMYVFGPRE